MIIKYEKIYNNLHLLEVQRILQEDNRNKAGIYLIRNNINGKSYVGSAITNRFNFRFRNHLIHLTGSKLVRLSVLKYGLENFSFFILEYFPNLINKENLSSLHVKLLERENFYIDLYKPAYNVLCFASSSLNYKHSDETKLKMRINYSQERKNRIGQLNKGQSFTKERRIFLSKIAKLRNSNQVLRDKFSQLYSKPVTLYNNDLSIHSKYSGIRAMAKAFNCCNKTINKYIKSKKIFRNIGIVQLDRS